MKKVLMIAYSFPPAGGPGVQRTSKFVKYLSKYGWEPVILTRSDSNIPLRDDSLFKDIPHDTNIIRTKAWDFSSGKGFIGLFKKFVGRKLLIPDSERLWEIFSRKEARSIIEKHDIRLIYTTSLPYSSHLMGLHLKKRYPHLSWVADFRDEWTNNPYILDNPYNPVRMKLEKRMEKQVLKTADCLIANTPVMLKNFIEKNSDISNIEQKFFVIPNGYDPDDFLCISEIANNVNSNLDNTNIILEASNCELTNEIKAAVTDKYHNLKNKRFTIIYTGSFYGRRKPDIFFEAIAKLIAENKIERAKINIKLIGNFKIEQIKNLVSRYKLEDVVDVFPYMEHNECIENMQSADCLLLIEGIGPGAEAFYTGKVFEYMIAGKPILAIVPENGAAAQLIRETSTGLISDCNDLEAICKNVEQLYTAWQKGVSIYNPNKEEIKKYDRANLTCELVKVFEIASDNDRTIK